jgi:hypothetical protein
MFESFGRNVVERGYSWIGSTCAGLLVFALRTYRSDRAAGPYRRLALAVRITQWRDPRAFRPMFEATRLIKCGLFPSSENRVREAFLEGVT